MSSTKITTVAALLLLAGAGALLFFQYQETTRLRAENLALRRQLDRMEVTDQNERLAKLTTRATPVSPPAGSNDTREVLRLRGEVGRLRQEQASHTNGPSPLSSITSNPDMVKMIRDQQKIGMSMLYKDFAKRANLAPDLSEKLNDMLADHVMSNVDQITQGLRDKKNPAQMEQAFSEQESVLSQKLQTLLGADGYSQYQDYTRNLASYLTAEQFKPLLSGETDAKEQQSKQLYQVMQEETQTALASAGLSPDFQTVPILNFRNIASADEAEKNLKLLDSIYERVSTRASAFLSEDDLKKFQDFRARALSNNRLGLDLNRKMMTPAQN